MQTQDVEQFKRVFHEMMLRVDSLELLQWSHDELEEQIGRLNAERAQGISDGSIVEVTGGPATGMRGVVVGRAEQDDSILLVDLDGIDVGAPVPIPALALTVLAT